MIKRTLTILLILLFKLGYSQFHVDTISDINNYNNNRYSFPIFKSETNQVAASKINTFLQLTILNLIVGMEDSIIFEHDWPTKENFHGRTFLDFKIAENSENILCIKFNTEYCAAYCEGYDFHYNFNSKTGDFISLTELFTKEGYDFFTEFINMQRKQTLLKTIVSCDNYVLNFIEKAKATNEINADLLYSIYVENKDERNIYIDCLEHIGDYTFNDDFLIENGNIHSYRERCSAHVNRAMDAIGDFNNSISINKLTPFYSDYGTSILLNSKTGDKQLSSVGKVYEGLVGENFATKLIITDKRKDKISGLLCYDNQGKGLPISGQVKDNNYTIFVSKDNWNGAGKIELQMTEDNKNATGKWYTKDYAVELPINLKIKN